MHQVFQRFEVIDNTVLEIACTPAVVRVEVCALLIVHLSFVRICRDLLEGSEYVLAQTFAASPFLLQINRTRGPEGACVVFDPIMAMHESQFAAHQPSFTP
jgi:hypothetical protein